jgi:hypothetical protein
MFEIPTTSTDGPRIELFVHPREKHSKRSGTTYHTSSTNQNPQQDNQLQSIGRIERYIATRTKLFETN